jgi:hypothetical protein
MWPYIVFAMLVFPGPGAALFTINLRVKGAGGKNVGPAPELTELTPLMRPSHKM